MLAGAFLAGIAAGLGCSPAPSSRAAQCQQLRERHARRGAGAPEAHLFGLADGAEIEEYFQAHHLAVTAVSGAPTRGEDGWRLTLVYPSFNAGGEAGGPTVVYPHEVTLLADEVEIEVLSHLELEGILLVLEVDESASSAYRWVGCAVPEEGLELDWFADRPELTLRP